MKKIYPFLEGAIPAEFISESIQSHTHKKDIGGHSIFLGQVRADIVEGKEVEGIEFTAYQEMAVEKLSQLREEIFSKYDLLCMHVYHSLGLVKKGGICLFVFTSSKHRKPAMLACDELVERIKKELPIWGKEIFSDNSYQWKENKQ
ncbi:MULTISPECIES: molybdenum cofactor biosynthesis protein MoaE [Apibacter]|uniref:molybdenum cofactor biosynthesis protein MoaE n=1 Tax=Apibacter TaxID=1778601 RepID=UPI000CF99E32|nr:MULTISPECIES: molybdenum cofactor biosynthesis protein MoaE [Apibacter]MCX8676541.1 molybdenum cofactor biosynthesis protein MoaE [Apibacter sp. B3919]MXO24002.1 molybdenum cofactor biosynthesis protein MoaE [Apibacter sp. B3924]MXO26320.1 molybdenum cofactor biosynthesis protein MoaE [Apibacter sp. B3813]MXO28271.1 molybdenum cofactor biosynthesis protein MoaE [Apibacter sp. B3913]MXO30225.1 molybdenum cofactor biosynthesis protein MoaE [Apibacter sp. B3912]